MCTGKDIIKLVGRETLLFFPVFFPLKFFSFLLLQAEKKDPLIISQLDVVIFSSFIEFDALCRPKLQIKGAY